MLHSAFTGSVTTAADKNLLAQELAGDVAGWLSEGIEQRGAASLIVSGGSTPAPFFRELCAQPIDWSRVTVTLADERWVPPDDELSNEKLIRENFLVGDASAASFLSFYNGALTPEEGWDDCDRTLRGLSTPYDVVVLGMGGDGHTASLFPDTDGLSDACNLNTDRLCWPMRPAHLTEARMTMTLAGLLNCRNLLLHITGDDKLDVFNQALAGTSFPIASVIEAAQERLQLYWSA